MYDCTVLHWSKYEYYLLPMGKSIARTFSKRKVELKKNGLEPVRPYHSYRYDCIVPAIGSWGGHIKKLEMVLARLQAAGCKKSLEYLRY